MTGKSILDSERSEPSGYTMFILFSSFFPLTNFLPERVLRFLQSNPISGSKLHIVGTLMRSFFDFLNSFLMRKEKLPNNYEKRQKYDLVKSRFFISSDIKNQCKL